MQQKVEQSPTATNQISAVIRFPRLLEKEGWSLIGQDTLIGTQCVK